VTRRKTPAPPPTPERIALIAQVRELYLRPMGLAEIRSIVGGAHTILNDLVNASGVPRRSQSAEMALTEEYNKRLARSRRHCVCGRILEAHEEVLCDACNPSVVSEADEARRIEIEFGNDRNWFARNTVRVGSR
jgi:hypothetical protein